MRSIILLTWIASCANTRLSQIAKVQKTAATNIKSTFGFQLRLPTVYALNILTSIEPAASATDARLQSAIHVRSACWECCRKCFHSISTATTEFIIFSHHYQVSSKRGNQTLPDTLAVVRKSQIRQRCTFAITMLILTRFENNKLAHTPSRDAMQKRMLQMRETVWER